MANKIEQTIDDIYDLIENCKYAAFSNKENIIVNKDDMMELLGELRDHIPEEIKKCQQIIVNKDMILDKARKDGDRIIEQAQAYQNQMVSENQIMQQAYAQANEIVSQAKGNAQELLASATRDANNYQMSAVQYTDDELQSLEDIISKTITNAESRYMELLNSLNEALNRVSANRAQLSRQVATDMGMPETATVQVEPGMLPEGEMPMQELPPDPGMGQQLQQTGAMGGTDDNVDIL
ncbi:MAG: hypothetical protein K6F35_05300 [Lachnospiraceae bacterium]|nr:hypothetical protein [Lachnospiraceae bacterium]